LKCKLCGAYSPYYNPTPHWDFNNLKISIDDYFRIVDYLDKFTISGGEPLIHPSIDKIIEYLNDNYSSQIGIVEIITNGTIVPNVHLISKLENLSNIQSRIIVDNYGPTLSKMISEIEEVLSKTKITYSIRKYYGKDQYYNGWIDMSDFSYRERNDEENGDIYSKCMFSNRFQRFLLVESKLYACATAKRCESLEKVCNGIDCLDLSSENTNLKESISSFFDRNHFKACEFCDGFNELHKRFPPAEQL
jgi:MoaA/NifB/PqqE/SkfB family radical SAM enzyme